MHNVIRKFEIASSMNRCNIADTFQKITNEMRMEHVHTDVCVVGFEGFIREFGKSCIRKNNKRSYLPHDCDDEPVQNSSVISHCHSKQGTSQELYYF